MISPIKAAFAVTVLLFAQVACDTTNLSIDGPNDEPEPVFRRLHPIRGEKEVTTSEMTITLTPAGGIQGSSWRYDPLDRTRKIEPIVLAGLLLATDEAGARANAVGPLPFRNRFTFTQSLVDSSGYYIVTPDSMDTNISNWPDSTGAPTHSDGRPKMFGDVMAWASFEPVVGEGATEASVEGVRVGMSAYLVDEFRMTNMVFIRYDLTNVSDHVIHNMYAAYGGDTDVDIVAQTGHSDCWAGYWQNQTGYDLERHLTFTYNSPDPALPEYPDECYGFVAGFSILASSSPGNIGSHKLAHRIWRRHGSQVYPDFSSVQMTTAEIILWAIQGYSYTGEPMVDPTTRNESKFAFTGDPVTQTGWVDERTDIRSMQSLQPFDFVPGETKSFTVVWIFAKGENLEHGLTQLKAYHDIVMSRPDVWDY